MVAPSERATRPRTVRDVNANHEARVEDVAFFGAVGAPGGQLFAANAEADGTPGDPTAPGAWWHVVPAGEEAQSPDGTKYRVIQGRDGRRFAVIEPQSILDAWDEDIYLDIDHQSMRWSGSTEAKGWFDQLKHDEDGGFFVRLSLLTPETKVAVDEKRYRRLSPVLRVRWPSAGEVENGAPPEPVVMAVVNVALTNRPNLRLASLNSEGAQDHEPERHETNRRNHGMSQPLIALAERLGLPKDATPEQIANAVDAQLVPRADLEQANERAVKAERELAEHREKAEAEARKAFAERADAAVANAVKERRIAPASEQYHRSGIRTAADLERFEAFAASVTPMLSDDDDGAANDAEETNAGRLSPEDIQMAKSLGLTPEEYLRGKED